VVDEAGGVRHCFGADVLDQRANAVTRFIGLATMLASGGAGQMYPNTTNPHVATGDGIAMAYRGGATISNMEFVQFHPTAMYGRCGAGKKPGPGVAWLSIRRRRRGSGGGRCCQHVMCLGAGSCCFAAACSWARAWSGCCTVQQLLAAPGRPPPWLQCLTPPLLAGSPCRAGPETGGRTFLITEAVRGEGGILLNMAGAWW